MSTSVLRPGQRYKGVTLKDGRIAVLRAPDFHDLDALLAFINELVDEQAQIIRTTKPSRDEEAEWLGGRLAAIEKGNLVALVAEVNGRLIANSEVEQRTQFPEMSHVGVLGIAILKDARGVGLGTALMESLIQLARQMKLKIVILDTFATNTIAQRLYRKIGFVEVGKIPKGIHRNGSYTDLLRFAIEM
jgi:RimJ/RimL family protein N-acetyltransferase